MLDLVARRRIDPHDVARVDAWIHTRRLKHTDRPHPDSPLDAKFSLQYVIARALVDRHVGIADFQGDAYRDARVQALLPRVHVSPYDDTQFSPDNHFGGAVRVTLRDGTVETARVEQALGRTSDNPVPPDRLRSKFALCAATVLRDDAVAPIDEAIERIDTLADMRTLTNLVMTGSVAQGKLN
jgi:2-methylcitrate dehydratase PrpD